MRSLEDFPLFHKIYEMNLDPLDNFTKSEYDLKSEEAQQSLLVDRLGPDVRWVFPGKLHESTIEHTSYTDGLRVVMRDHWSDYYAHTLNGHERAKEAGLKCLVEVEFVQIHSCTAIATPVGMESEAVQLVNGKSEQCLGPDLEYYDEEFLQAEPGKIELGLWFLRKDKNVLITLRCEEIRCGCPFLNEYQASDGVQHKELFAWLQRKRWEGAFYEVREVIAMARGRRAWG